MNIRNPDHATTMLEEWKKLPLPARKREIKLAIEKLELSRMYYEQKDNDKGVERAGQCITLLQEQLDALED